MNHAIFVIPAYALGILLPLMLAVQAAFRLRSARRTLAVLEPHGRTGRRA